MTDEIKPAAQTDYIVLRQHTQGDDADQPLVSWVEVKPGETVTALNAQAAIKAATNGEGTFVAVPARSWKPLTRKVETVTKDVWA